VLIQTARDYAFGFDGEMDGMTAPARPQSLEAGREGFHPAPQSKGHRTDTD
jgi:hypothetical protein